MTDNEIKQALECCKSENGNDCEDCPCQNVTYKQGNGGCCNALMGYALDLINRKDAEIEKLTKIEHFATKTIEKQSAEIERLEDSNKRLKEAVGLMLNNDNGVELIKSEAIKEFAERLKAEYVDFAELHEEIRHDNLILAVDNLVKEMTEGNG